jgi:quercetin dioxygenase-like cupin family protein
VLHQPPASLNDTASRLSPVVRRQLHLARLLAKSFTRRPALPMEESVPTLAHGVRSDAMEATMKTYAILILAICALLALPTPSVADDEDVPTKTLLTTTETLSGQKIIVTPEPKVQAMVLTIPPGKSLPIHKHPYTRYGYVVKGVLDLTLIDQKKVIRFKTGEFFAEVVEQWHFGTNNGKVPVELLVIDQMPPDVTSNTQLQHKQ